jgi:hypothetical protein
MVQSVVIHREMVADFATHRRSVSNVLGARECFCHAPESPCRCGGRKLAMIMHRMSLDGCRPLWPLPEVEGQDEAAIENSARAFNVLATKLMATRR